MIHLTLFYCFISRSCRDEKKKFPFYFSLWWCWKWEEKEARETKSVNETHLGFQFQLFSFKTKVKKSILPPCSQKHVLKIIRLWIECETFFFVNEFHSGAVYMQSFLSLGGFSINFFVCRSCGFYEACLLRDEPLGNFLFFF